MRHYSMYPLMWAAACGAANVRKFFELDLVDCPECRRVAVLAEIRGRIKAAAS